MLIQAKVKVTSLACLIAYGPIGMKAQCEKTLAFRLIELLNLTLIYPNFTLILPDLIEFCCGKVRLPLLHAITVTITK